MLTGFEVFAIVLMCMIAILGMMAVVVLLIRRREDAFTSSLGADYDEEEDPFAMIPPPRPVGSQPLLFHPEDDTEI